MTGCNAMWGCARRRGHDSEQLGRDLMSRDTCTASLMATGPRWWTSRTLLSAAGKRVEPGFKPLRGDADGMQATVLDSVHGTEEASGEASPRTTPLFKTTETPGPFSSRREPSRRSSMPTPRTATRRPTASGTGSRLSLRSTTRDTPAHTSANRRASTGSGTHSTCFFDTLTTRTACAAMRSSSADELELQHVISRQRPGPRESGAPVRWGLPPGTATSTSHRTSPRAFRVECEDEHLHRNLWRAPYAVARQFGTRAAEWCARSRTRRR